MSHAMADEATFPDEVRRKSAHVLAGLLTLQGVAAAGSLAWLVAAEGRALGGFVTPLLALVAISSFAAAGLEWGRNRQAETVAAIALLLSFGCTLTLVLAGIWYLVPFVGLATIIAIFGLVDRFAVRDETKHQPKH